MNKMKLSEIKNRNKMGVKADPDEFRMKYLIKRDSCQLQLRVLV